MLHSFSCFCFCLSCLPLVSLPLQSACKCELDGAWNHNTASQKVSFLPTRVIRQWQEWGKLLLELVTTQWASIPLRTVRQQEQMKGTAGLLCASCPLSPAVLAPGVTAVPRLSPVKLLPHIPPGSPLGNSQHHHKSCPQNSVIFLIE